MVQRVGGWRARRTLAQTENKTPKQNAFKPGRWVGLDPFAPGQIKTIKKRSPRAKVEVCVRSKEEEAELNEDSSRYVFPQ